MILDNIIAFFIGFCIVILLYTAVVKYRWHKLKCHVIKAIDALDLWDKVNTMDIKGIEFRAITMFLDDNKYKHCFYGQGSAFKLYYMLAEIRNDHERS